MEKEIRKNFKVKENKNTIWLYMKKKKKGVQINVLTFQLKTLENKDKLNLM